MQPDAIVAWAYPPLLFAVFTAYWAQTTQRSVLLWFAFGFALPPVTGLVLLWLNSRPRQVPPNRLDDPGRADLLSVRKDLV